MTKREHDAATKENWGGKGMASDERWSYRRRRGVYLTAPRDYIAERAAYMAWRNHPSAIGRDGFLPTLGIGSRYRVPQAYRARTGAPLLTRS